MPAAGRRGLPILLLGYLPVLWACGLALWSRPHYQFFPFALAGAALLAWRGWQGRKADSVGRPGAMLGFAALALGLLVLSAWLGSAWLGGISALTLLVGLILGLGGPSLLAALGPALLLLCLLVRLPLRLDMEMVFSLRRLAVGTASEALDLLRVPHYLSGNVVDLKDGKMLVDEACSGINSAIFVVALAWFYGCWRGRGWFHVAVLVLASVAFVLMGNVLRIAGGVALKSWFEVNILSGWQHGAVGLLLFAGYVGLVASMDVLGVQVRDFVAWLRHRRRSAAPATAPPPPVLTPPPPPPPRPLSVLVAELFGQWPAKSIVAVCAVFAALGTIQAGLTLARPWIKAPHLSLSRSSGLKSEARFTLPATLGTWQQLDRGQIDPVTREAELAGRTVHTRSFAFTSGGMGAVVSLDYPYYDYHDLMVCYRGNGWEIADCTTREEASGGRASFFEVNMTRRPVAHGYLLFGAFGRDGQWFEGLRGRLKARFRGLNPPVFQVQALVCGLNPLTPGDKQQVQQLFLQARQALVKQVLAQLEGKR